MYALAWSYRQGWDIWSQLGAAILLTLVTSAVYGLISMRMRGVPFLMVTLAAGMVIYGVAYRWSAVTGGVNGIAGIRRPEGVSQYWEFYFLVLAAFVLVSLVLLIVSRSPFGLTLRGIRDSESRMVSLGYNVPLYKFWAIMLSGVVAGLAGVLAVWHSEFISPAVAGFQESSMSLIMVALGGIGTVLRPGRRSAARHKLPTRALQLIRTLVDAARRSLHPLGDLRAPRDRRSGLRSLP